MKRKIKAETFRKRAVRAARENGLKLGKDSNGWYLADEAAGEVVATGMIDAVLADRFSLLKSFESLE